MFSISHVWDDIACLTRYFEGIGDGIVHYFLIQQDTITRVAAPSLTMTTLISMHPAQCIMEPAGASDGAPAISPVPEPTSEVDRSFAHVVAAVPQLAADCSSALTSKELPGSGLKLLRLVSRQLRTALLRAIAGYTLHLEGGTSEMNDVVRLLADTKLSHLTVIVQSTTAGKSLSRYCAAFPISEALIQAYHFHLCCCKHCELMGKGPAPAIFTECWFFQGPLLGLLC